MTPGPPTKKKTSVTTRLSGRPPRPPNAWMIYRTEKQKEMSSGGPTQASLSKVIADKWKAEPSHIRALYKSKADEEAAKHKEKYPNYKFQPLKRSEKEVLLKAQRDERERQREEAREAKRRDKQKVKRSASGASQTHQASPPSSVVPKQESSPSTSRLSQPLDASPLFNLAISPDRLTLHGPDTPDKPTFSGSRIPSVSFLSAPAEPSMPSAMSPLSPDDILADWVQAPPSPTNILDDLVNSSIRADALWPTYDAETSGYATRNQDNVNLTFSLDDLALQWTNADLSQELDFDLHVAQVFAYPTHDPEQFDLIGASDIWSGPHAPLLELQLPPVDKDGIAINTDAWDHILGAQASAAFEDNLFAMESGDLEKFTTTPPETPTQRPLSPTSTLFNMPRVSESASPTPPADDQPVPVKDDSASPDSIWYPPVGAATSSMRRVAALHLYPQAM